MKLLVLGGGPAGLTAALQARELNAEVTLIEAHRIGGTSLNRGPAPVRSLARAARLVRDTKSWPAFGLRGPGPELDLATTLENAGRVADYVHHERRLSEHLASAGIELVEDVGPAHFVDPHNVVVEDGRKWQADRIIIAVGGHPGRLSVPGAELGLTYTDIRGLTALPGRVAVIGGADTGCQLASIMADFGCQTVLLEFGPRLIPRADQDISSGLGVAFTAAGDRGPHRGERPEADPGRAWYRGSIRRSRRAFQSNGRRGLLRGGLAGQPGGAGTGRGRHRGRRGSHPRERLAADQCPTMCSPPAT